MLAFGRDFAKDLSAGSVLELVGDVGSGKTTFVRGLAAGLGVKDFVTSPSFTISKSYALPGGGQFVHYDFYRLSDPGLIAEDLAEAMSVPENIIVVEWGESVGDVLPEGRTKLLFKYLDDGSREVAIQDQNSGRDRPAVSAQETAK